MTVKDEALNRMQRACARSEGKGKPYILSCAEVAAEMVEEERSATITSDPLASVLVDIVKERQRQDEKFGLEPPSILPGDDDWRKLAVLSEEVGEVARGLLEHSFGTDGATLDHVEEELIQVAAVAVAWVEFNRSTSQGE